MCVDRSEVKCQPLPYFALVVWYLLNGNYSVQMLESQHGDPPVPNCQHLTPSVHMMPLSKQHLYHNYAAH